VKCLYLYARWAAQLFLYFLNALLEVGEDLGFGGGSVDDAGLELSEFAAKIAVKNGFEALVDGLDWVVSLKRTGMNVG